MNVHKQTSHRAKCLSDISSSTHSVILSVQTRSDVVINFRASFPIGRLFGNILFPFLFTSLDSNTVKISVVYSKIIFSGSARPMQLLASLPHCEIAMISFLSQYDVWSEQQSKYPTLVGRNSSEFL
jgi:hypothetical protein